MLHSFKRPLYCRNSRFQSEVHFFLEGEIRPRRGTSAPKTKMKEDEIDPEDEILACCVCTHVACAPTLRVDVPRCSRWGRGQGQVEGGTEVGLRSLCVLRCCVTPDYAGRPRTLRLQKVRTRNAVTKPGWTASPKPRSQPTLWVALPFPRLQKRVIQN